VARVWGTSIISSGQRLGLRAAPLYGRWDPVLTLRITAAVAVAIAVVWRGPQLARRARFGTLVVAAGMTTMVWSVSLALVDGADAITAPLVGRHEQLPFARDVADVGTFVDTFTERIAGYPIHVQGHPPASVVLFALLDRVGLAGSGWVAVLVITGGGVAVAATLVVTRSLAGEAAARAAAPFLVLLPAAIWIASTVDALYAGVGLGGVALIALAMQRRRTGAAWLALTGGAALGLAVHLSYGLVLIGALVFALAWRHRCIRPVVWASIGGAAVTVGFLVAGFAWWEGLAATHERYTAGIASTRPYGYSLVGNLAALALASGPVVAVGLARWRSVATALVAPVIGAVVIADLLGLSKGEVERIWLFLVIPLAVAAGAVATRARPWLALQATAAITLASWLRTPW
jgi:hypothetical protein